MKKKLKLHKKISSFQVIILGFLGVVLIGALLLMLPFATKDGMGASFGDALFTATSATCVTGLVVQDTGSYWSLFGQGVLLVLIQIGGLGVVTVAAAIVRFSGRKISLMQRSTLQDSISAPTVGGIVRLMNFILKGVFAIELLGAVCMAPYFCGEFGFWGGIGRSVFHSISAFCNAGFDVLGTKQAPFVSLTGQTAQPLINVVIMLLIIVGGLGFLTWEDMKTHRLHLRRYRLQSKLILSVTAVLIVVPALFLYFYEFTQPQWSDCTTTQKVFASLFQSVTLRTAGFNTVDFAVLSEPTKAVMIVWMLIGGAPGSTAGGLKVTTVAVLIMSAFSVFRRRNDVTCFNRRLPDGTVNQAAAILMMYILLFFIGGVAISCIEGLPLLDCLFETASAIGTVGVTTGITTGLTAASKGILIVLMYLGRVGGLTLIFAATAGPRTFTSRFPKEKVTVG